MVAGGAGGAGGGLKVLADGHLGVDQDVTEPGVADSTEQVLDDFTRVVEPPTVVAGDALGVTPVKYGLRTEYRAYGVSHYPDPSTLATSGPTTYGPTVRPSVSATQEAGSYIGADATPHTRRPPGHGCGGLEFWYAGWRESEVWFRFDILAQPSGMAGMTGEWSSSLGAGEGVAGSHGLDIVAKSSAPTGTRQGEVIGRLPAGGTSDFFVPARLIPAAGGELWIGLRAAWGATLGATYCGFTTPRQVGVANSGYFATTPWPTAMTWAVESVAGDDLGTIAEDDTDEAPWDGGNAWRDAGIEGSPTWGIDGEAFWVEAEAPAGKGIVLQGEGEDEDEAWGPWGAGWSFAFDFEVDVVGDTGEAGLRHIEVTTTRPGARTIGYVHLGDSQRDPGISVQAPTTSDYEAVTITAGARWSARFDDRLEREDDDGEMVRYLRGKLWRKADGEPAGWHVEVQMDATEDVGDSVMIWFRVGNGAGDSQTVRFMLPRAISEETTSGAWVTEFLGLASGLTDRIDLSSPHVTGTLAVDVAGITVRPLREEPGTGWLDWRPTAGMHLWATYLAE